MYVIMIPASPADGDQVTTALDADATNGSATVFPDGTFIYTPNPGFAGDDSFTYAANDGLAASIGTIRIRVSHPPLSVDDAYTATEDTPLVIAAAAGLLANDSDDDGDSLTAVPLTNPTNGTVTLNPDGSFTYTPAANFHGTDSFTYAASDGTWQTPATVTITVASANEPPQWAADAYGVNLAVGEELTVDAISGVLANDTDPDGDTMAAIVNAWPAHGQLTLNNDGSFDYLADSGYSGPDSFTYHSSDGHAASAVVTVSLYVGYYDFAASSFTSDGTNLTIAYTVIGSYAPPFLISLYSSSDGVQLGDVLQSIPADTSPGTHTLTLAPQFADLQQDYYLVAAVDGDDQVPESDETNNALAFAGGAFVASDPTTGGNVLQYQGGAAAEDVFFVPKDAATVRLLIGDPAAPAREVSAVPHYDYYYDVTGDQSDTSYGTVSQLDVDAIAFNLTHNQRLWRNPSNRWDVSGDGYVSPIDPLVILNQLNSAGTQILAHAPVADDYFLDVSGDNVVSMLDYRQVLNVVMGGSGYVGSRCQNYANPSDVNLDGVANADDLKAVLDYLAGTSVAATDYLLSDLGGLNLRTHAGNDRAAPNLPTASTLPLWLFGGDGVDTLTAAASDDYLEGGAGADLLTANSGDDTIAGGDGNDTVNGGDGNDALAGGAGDDTLSGDAGSDVLHGGDGSDVVNGGDGNDELHGGLGADILNAGDGNDWIWGDDGDDTLDGGQGDDQLFGGLGADSVADGGGAGDTFDPDGEFLQALVGYTADEPLTLEGETAQIRFHHLPGGGMQSLVLTVQIEDGDAHFSESTPARVGTDTGGGATFTVVVPAGEDSVSDPISITLEHDSEIEDIENYWVHIVNVEGGGYAPSPYDLAQEYVFDASIDARDDDVPLDGANSVTIEPLANDYRAAAQDLHIASVTQPQHGDVEGVCLDDDAQPTTECDGRPIISLIYTPHEGYEGVDDSFAYTAEDDFGQQDQANVFLSAQATRRVTSVSSSKGRRFWEGDTVTFTASLSGAIPGADESFTWEACDFLGYTIGVYGDSSAPRYSEWRDLQKPNAATMTNVFSAPFDGVIRVTLVSGGGTSRATIVVRAAAAFPVNFNVDPTRPAARVDDHLTVYYTYESSSGRMADLDGVEMGEFVWYTWAGYYMAPSGIYRFWNPPFDYEQPDGVYVRVTDPTAADPNNVNAGALQDDHGVGVKISNPVVTGRSDVAHQYYYYIINDGAYQDPEGQVKFKWADIKYSVVSFNNARYYKIDKGGDGSIMIDLTGLSFPWTAR